MRKEQRNATFINSTKNCLCKVGRTMYGKRENYKRELHVKNISSRRAFGYRIFIIRRKGRNIVHNTILLHTKMAVEEEHLVYLPLIFYLQFLLLSGKIGLQFFLLGKQAHLQLLRLFLLGHKIDPEFIHILLQLGVLLLCPLVLSLQGFPFLLQLVRFIPDSSILPLSQFQHLRPIRNNLLSGGQVIFHHL